jgi:hypothetical protein
MCVRERTRSGSSASYRDLTLQRAKKLRERCNKRRDDPFLDGGLVTRPVYQLDWSALLMGVLPLRIGELAEGSATR